MSAVHEPTETVALGSVTVYCRPCRQTELADDHARELEEPLRPATPGERAWLGMTTGGHR